MKKNGLDYDECCYKEMTHTVGGQSMPADYHNDPIRNEYENNHKSFYGKNGVDWSGME